MAIILQISYADDTGKQVHCFASSEFFHTQFKPKEMLFHKNLFHV